MLKTFDIQIPNSRIYLPMTLQDRRRREKRRRWKDYLYSCPYYLSIFLRNQTGDVQGEIGKATGSTIAIRKHLVLEAGSTIARKHRDLQLKNLING